MNPLREIVILPIRIYRKTVAPLLPPACRYHPTCSQYFIDAVRKRGIVIGVVKGVWRILRCHPWGGSGIDEA